MPNPKKLEARRQLERFAAQLSELESELGVPRSARLEKALQDLKRALDPDSNECPKCGYPLTAHVEDNPFHTGCLLEPGTVRA